MIIIHTALLFEASEAIKRYRLKEARDLKTACRIYTGEDKNVALVLTGSGAFASVSGVSSALTFLGAGPGDLFFNFGIAGSEKNGEVDHPAPGDLMRAFKCSCACERPFYPDIIYGSKSGPAEVVTLKDPLEYRSFAGNDTTPNLPKVFDMELYHAFRTANLFLGPEALVSYKVISDIASETAASGGVISKKKAESIVSDAWDRLFPEMEAIGSQIRKDNEKANALKTLPPDTGELYLKICGLFGLTFAAREMFGNRLRKDILLGVDVNSRMEDFLENKGGSVPKDKKAKEAFFKENFLSGPAGGDSFD